MLVALRRTEWAARESGGALSPRSNADHINMQRLEALAPHLASKALLSVWQASSPPSCSSSVGASAR